MAAELIYGATEYIQIPSITFNGAPPSIALSASMTFVPYGQNLPAAPTWYTAMWGSAGVLQVLVGPAGGAVNLARGNYVVYGQILAPPETVILAAGRLVVQ